MRLVRRRIILLEQCSEECIEVPVVPKKVHEGNN